VIVSRSFIFSIFVRIGQEKLTP